MQYRIVNTTRSSTTRGLRAGKPVVRKTQFLPGAIRVLPSSYVNISDEYVSRNFAVLRGMEAAGIIKVTTVSGLPVRLDSLKSGFVPPPAPIPQTVRIESEVVIKPMVVADTIPAPVEEEASLDVEEAFDGADDAEEEDEETSEAVDDKMGHDNKPQANASVSVKKKFRRR